MTTYVLGAGASYQAGYPLAKSMALELFQWMKSQAVTAESYAARYPATAQFLEEHFGPIENIEDLLTRIQDLISSTENRTREQRGQRGAVANEYGVLKNAIRSWFSEIQSGVALSSTIYRTFARDIVADGDSIITFNYDVSLDRELKLAGKFEVGDGYGFQIESLPGGSPTKIFKLHGSTSWLALLFNGLTSGFFQFEPGRTLGLRPVIGKKELSFLGYAGAADPRFAKGGAALPVMIFPARSKEFYFAANTGIEYEEFWNNLWGQASAALRSAERVVMCGYSLLEVDQRARELLLSAPRKDSEIFVGSGGDTERIVNEYRNAGYRRVMAAEEVFFERWVTGVRNGAALAR